MCVTFYSKLFRTKFSLMSLDWSVSAVWFLVVWHGFRTRCETAIWFPFCFSFYNVMSFLKRRMRGETGSWFECEIQIYSFSIAEFVQSKNYSGESILVYLYLRKIGEIKRAEGLFQFPKGKSKTWIRHQSQESVRHKNTNLFYFAFCCITFHILLFWYLTSSWSKLL